MAYSAIKEFDTRHISCTSALPKLNYKLSSTHVPPLICHMSNSVLCLGDTNLVLKIWEHLQSADINYGYRKTSVGGRQQFIIRDLAFSSLASHVTNSHRPPNSTPSATFHPSGGSFYSCLLPGLQMYTKMSVGIRISGMENGAKYLFYDLHVLFEWHSDTSINFKCLSTKSRGLSLCLLVQCTS